MDGNTDAIWGFLDDIWHWHFNKISPFDPQRKMNQNHNSSLTPTRETNLKNINPRNSIERQSVGGNDLTQVSLNNKFLPPKKPQLDTRPQTIDN